MEKGTKDLLNTGGIDHCREEHEFLGETSKFDIQSAASFYSGFEGSKYPEQAGHACGINKKSIF